MHVIFNFFSNVYNLAQLDIRMKSVDVKFGFLAYDIDSHVTLYLFQDICNQQSNYKINYLFVYICIPSQ